MSKTGSLAYSDVYRKYDSSPSINIRSTTLSRNSNYNFSIGYQPKKSFSINGSIGVATYGFQYSGDLVTNPSNLATSGSFSIKEAYTPRLMEVGLSASYRIAYKNDLTFIIRPGAAWYTNPKESFSQRLGIFMHSNNFSATFFTGIEMPISSNTFYINIGLNTKVALSNFARINDLDIKFHPFALGLQTSISYRFGSFYSK